MKALLLVHNQDVKGALQYIGKAIELKIREDLHFELFVHYEAGMIHHDAGDTASAEDEWKNGLKLLDKKEIHPYFKELFQAKIQKKSNFTPRVNLREIKFNIKPVIEFARQDHNISMLHRKVHEINFLSNLQNIIFSNKTREELISSVRDLLNNSFLFESTLFFYYRDHQWVPFDFEENHRLENFEKIIEFLNVKAGHSIDFIREKEVTLLNSGISSILYLPIINEEINEYFGIFLCLSKNKKIKFDYDDYKILNIAASQITQAYNLIEANNKIYLAATVDSLTGVYNRQTFFRKLKDEEKRYRRYNKGERKSFSVFFIDMDNFKSINDLYGHTVGDLILKEFTQILKNSIRDVDFIGRFGGDEFVIILPETKAEDSVPVAKRILSNISKVNGFADLLQNHPCTSSPTSQIGCSIGISEFDPETCESIDHVIESADKALYEAKSKGKNTFEIFRQGDE